MIEILFAVGIFLAGGAFYKTHPAKDDTYLRRTIHIEIRPNGEILNTCEEKPEVPR